MPEIDPKLAQKVLDADLANMAMRVQEGKNLTANQRAHFLQATGQIALPESGVAKNKVELAGILGVTRQTIYKWQKHEDCPVPNSDGTYNIADWLAFIKLHGLKGSEDDSGMDLRDRKMLGQCEDRSGARNPEGQLGSEGNGDAVYGRCVHGLSLKDSALADGRQSEGRSVE